jgi:sarcosine oxidase
MLLARRDPIVPLFPRCVRFRISDSTPKAHSHRGFSRMHAVHTIILGLGSMGCAAALHLAQRGVRVLGLEQFSLGHANGSSHGHTRIIRQAYYEHPDYVPLVLRAYDLWYDLEQSIGEHLLTSSPCLSVGLPESELITGVVTAAQQHHLPIERFDASAIARRFPAFRIPAEYVGVVETTAGILAVDRCVLALANEARRQGANLRDNEPVVAWQREGSGFVVQTTKESYRSQRLLLTAGPWATSVLPQLRVMRQTAHWFAAKDRSLFRRDRFPVFLIDTPEGYFYGIPATDRRGVKVARHYGAPEVSDVSQIQREIHPEDESALRGFLREWIPEADAPMSDASVCIYTLSPDRHFVIDAVPNQEGAYVAGGFSGHGFKFAPVVGEILADLAQHGKTAHPIGLFAVDRFG